ncbi:MAG: histidinol-phosphate transaminase [Muribaculaceae bacterium]|nr:histidinol-phosphate transaminase [Muribaculaceae bacterium]
MQITDLIRPNIRSLQPYSTARDEYEGELGIFLDANESPYDNGYNRYPDPHQKRLKSLLSPIKRVEMENIFIGNGSDEAIDLLFRIFCQPGRSNAISISPSYGMYEVAADTNDVKMRKVLLNDDFSLPVDRLLEAADSDSRLLFICSPNNPTGNAFPREEIERVVRGFPGIVVVDEAYIDFSDEPGMLPVLSEYPNLVVLQTLSKAWGMAGLRCGLAFASAEIIGYMNRVKYPYNINVATSAIAERLLSEPVAEHIRIIKKERRKLAESLADLPFVESVYPSDANFLLVKVRDANALYDYLIGKKIIVRNRDKVVLCKGCLRMTVGTPEENQRLITTLKEYEEKTSDC